MEVPKRRGRKAGVTKQITTIKDPALGKFHIEIENRTSFNVMEEGSDKPVAFCSNLPSAIKRIAHDGLFTTNDSLTLKEYINSYKAEYDKIHKALEM